MKKIIAIALAILFIGGAAAMAGTTTGAGWDNDLGWGNGIREYATGHDHSNNCGYVDRWSELYEQKMEMGGIASVVLVREVLFGIPYTVGTQGHYDANNNNWGVYGKVEVDISKQIKDVWNSLWGK